MICRGADEWPTANEAEIIPCSPLKPEMIQEDKIDEVCNEAFDKLFT